MPMKRQRGFSLVELMMVLVVLTIVMGVIFQQIISMQERYKTEEMRTDMFSEAREFVDQFARDIHESGFPATKNYASGVLGSPVSPTDSRLAVGIVSASPTDLWLEGDVDGDGQVDSVRYTLVAGAGGTCPCTLRRSQIIKLGGTNPWSQPTSYSTEVNGVLNSLGMGGGGAALLVSGQSSSVQANGTTVVSNDDTYFTTMKSPQLFRYYDGTGAAINVNTDISSGGGQAVIKTIRTVRLMMNLVASAPDPKTGIKPYVTLGAIAKLPNCSMYAVNSNPPVAGC
jgi:prepilin-type N-terminal cleavage/methylation domain-containing protein